MTDLTTNYLGLTLPHPIVASSSPLTGSLESLKALEAAGVAAVVLPSLFEEQVEHDDMMSDNALGASSFGPEGADGYFDQIHEDTSASASYLDLIEAAKSYLSVPVIASLNGNTPGGWAHYASVIQEAGADALELNVYHVAADPDATSEDVESRYLHLVEGIRSEIDIPLAVKIGPFFSSPANMARRLADAGADAIVAFNRFYQPDLDLENLSVAPNLTLSVPAEQRMVLRWIGIMSGRIDAQLAATTGIHDAEGVVKLILAGADVTMMASALLINGPGHVAKVLEDVQAWFSERDYESLDQARGSVSQQNVADPDSFERSNYMKTLVSYTQHS